MGYVKGDNIRFYTGGVVLNLEMEVSINYTVDTIETTDKDSPGSKTFIAGDDSWTCSGSANLDWTATTNVSQVFTQIKAKAAVEIDVGSSTDSKFYGGSGIFTAWSFEGPRNGLATLSFEVQGTGALTEGTTT